jgi:hypothetical protein
MPALASPETARRCRQVWQPRRPRETRRSHQPGQLKVVTVGSGNDRRIVYMSSDSPTRHGPRSVLDTIDASSVVTPGFLGRGDPLQVSPLSQTERETLARPPALAHRAL